MKTIPVLNIERLKEVAKSNAKEPNGTLKNSVKRAKKILRILERDNYSCVKCGRKDNLTIDHPNGREFAKYDNHQKYQLNKCQVLCVLCHTAKNEQDIVTKELRQT